jgi:hypothetical protein
MTQTMYRVCLLVLHWLAVSRLETSSLVVRPEREFGRLRWKPILESSP